MPIRGVQVQVEQVGPAAARRGERHGFKSALQRVGMLASVGVMHGCAQLGGPGVDGSTIRDVLGREPIDQLHMGVYAIDLSS
ncbi:MAG: hypothetical protein P8L45_01785, partial [Longimicrobiales bacterium]|nr:hypothetical protein [Longimicrobiales bacterium]